MTPIGGADSNVLGAIDSAWHQIVAAAPLFAVAPVGWQGRLSATQPIDHEGAAATERQSW